MTCGVAASIDVGVGNLVGVASKGEEVGVKVAKPPPIGVGVGVPAAEVGVIVTKGKSACILPPATMMVLGLV